MSLLCPICFDTDGSKASYEEVQNHSWQNHDRCDAHGICRTCLQRYVEGKIFDAGSWHIRCPGLGCGYHLVDADIATSLCGSLRREEALRRHAMLRGQTCGARLEELGALASLEPGSCEQLLLEQCQVCPRCFVFARREDGCPHLVCRCGCDYCDGCGGPHADENGEFGCACEGAKVAVTPRFVTSLFGSPGFEGFEATQKKFWRWLKFRSCQLARQIGRKRYSRFGRWLREVKKHAAFTGELWKEAPDPAHAQHWQELYDEAQRYKSELLAEAWAEVERHRQADWELELQHGRSAVCARHIMNFEEGRILWEGAASHAEEGDWPGWSWAPDADDATDSALEEPLVEELFVESMSTTVDRDYSSARSQQRSQRRRRGEKSRKSAF